MCGCPWSKGQLTGRLACPTPHGLQTGGGMPPASDQIEKQKLHIDKMRASAAMFKVTSHRFSVPACNWGPSMWVLGCPHLF